MVVDGDRHRESDAVLLWEEAVPCRYGGRRSDGGESYEMRLVSCDEEMDELGI